LLHLSSVYANSIAKWDASPGFLEPSIYDHFGAVKLARDFDLQRIRPMAMYCCMSPPLHQTYRIFEAAKISAEDRRLCILAIQPMKVIQFECSKFLMRLGPAPKCAAPKADSSAKQDVIADIMTTEGSSFLSKSFEVEPSVCDLCLVSMGKALLQSRREAWEKIPDIFQCLPWEQLTQLCQATCG
jgi:hypothetical protein